MADTADIALTPSAAARVAAIAVRQGKPPILRLSVEGGGCAGFQYRFGLADEVAADDLAVARDGVTLVVDPRCRSTWSAARPSISSRASAAPPSRSPAPTPPPAAAAAPASRSDPSSSPDLRPGLDPGIRDLTELFSVMLNLGCIQFSNRTARRWILNRVRDDAHPQAAKAAADEDRHLQPQRHRARLPRLVEYLDEQKPDVLCLQEVKCADEAFPIEDLARPAMTASGTARRASTASPS